MWSSVKTVVGIIVLLVVLLGILQILIAPAVPGPTVKGGEDQQRNLQEMQREIEDVHNIEEAEKVLATAKQLANKPRLPTKAELITRPADTSP